MEFLKSPPGDDPVEMEAIFRAPIARVWRAWTEVERVLQWFGRAPRRLVSAEMDLRIGGRWTYLMRDDAAGREGFTGAYTEITPETRLAFTWCHVDEPTDGPRRESPVSEVTVDFEAMGAATRLTLRHAGLSTDQARQGVGAGWTEAIAAIARLVEQTGT